MSYTHDMHRKLRPSDGSRLHVGKCDRCGIMTPHASCRCTRCNLIEYHAWEEARSCATFDALFRLCEFLICDMHQTARAKRVAREWARLNPEAWKEGWARVDAGEFDE